MRIKTKLDALLLMAGAMLFTVSVTIIVNYFRIQSMTAELKNIDSIVRTLQDFNVLCYESLLRDDTMDNKEFQNKYTVLSVSLKKVMEEEEKDRSVIIILKHINQEARHLNNMFNQILDIRRQETDAKSRPVRLEILQRIAYTQFLAKNNALSNLTADLQEKVHRKMISSFVMTNVLLVFNVIIFIAMLFVLWLFFRKSIGKPLQLLQKAAEAIGGGSLGHVVPVQSSDEIGVLAGAFNEMTRKLSSSYRELTGEIDERDRLAGQLRQNEKKYRSLFESMSSAFAYHEIVTDEKGVPVDYIFLEVNDGFEKFTGLKGTDILHQRVSRVFPDIGQSSFDWIGSYGRVALTGEPLSFDQYFPPLKKWYSILAYSPQRNYFAVLFTDITSRKQAEEILAARYGELEKQVEAGTVEIVQLNKEVLNEMEKRRETEEALIDSEERMRALINASNESLFMIDRQYKVLVINEMAAGRLNAKVKELIGEDIFQFLPPHIARRRQPQIEEVFLHGVPLTMEDERAGIFFTSNIVPVRDKNGKVSRVAIFAADVTARKKAEEALRHSLRELERYNKELEEFIFIASHDLQEPLRKALTFSNLLKDALYETAGEEERYYLATLQDSVERMRKLLEDIILLSRVTTKAAPFAALPLESVMEELKKRSSLYADIRVGELPVIEADRLQIQQLFHNLISNAIQFAGSGVFPVIAIQATMVDAEMVEITVSDNGIGFEEKYREKIFEPFERLHGREEYKGTGMGLAICRKIVHRHGGTITAHSEAGKGSSFIIRLPLQHRTSNELDKGYG